MKITKSFQLLNVVLIGLTILTTNCTFRTPAHEEPAPELKTMPKAFFYKNVKANGAESLPLKLEPRRFLCGWAPEKEAGAYGQYVLSHTQNSAYGCNIEFEITETALIGRLVNPNFPKDKGQWEKVISIPIQDHYYVESDRDQYGRKENETIRNSDRSEWALRPYMTLDLDSVEVTKWAFGLTPLGTKALHHSDPEFDFDGGFWGFTLHVQDQYLQSSVQGQFRFNFLAFESDANFQRAYFPAANARYINAVFPIGQQADDLSSVYWIARWPLDKTQNIYLFDFPSEKMEKAAQEVLDSYNRELTKILKPEYPGIFPFFVAVRGTGPHSFDLRKPSITWVQDERLSLASPLGVAYINPDLENGKVLWGGFTIWGGSMERYIRQVMPASATNANIGLGMKRARIIPGSPNFPVDLSLDFLDIGQFVSAPLNLPELVRDTVPNSVVANFQSLGLEVNKLVDPIWLREAQLRWGDLQKRNVVTEQNGETHPLLNADQLASLQVELTIVSERMEKTQKALQSGLSYGIGHFQQEAREAQIVMQQNQNPFGFPFGQVGTHERDVLGANFEQLSYRDKEMAIRGESREAMSEVDQLLNRGQAGMIHDADRTLQDIAEEWTHGLLEAQNQDPAFDSEKALVVVIKGVMSHEFGHVLGLGHNFKGSVLPKVSELPKALYAKAKQKATGEYSGKKISIYSHSIMDYSHGRTEVAYSDEDTEPQAQDIQVLNYIYGRRYPVSVGETDFIYEKLPAESWEIPLQQAYLSQCNDVKATMGDDPYCARHDIGYDAPSIVKGYFESLDNNMIYTTFALNGARGSNPGAAESYAWYRAFKIMNRVRVFYDYFRSRLAEERPQFVGDLMNNTKALLGFSDACAAKRVPGVVFPKVLTDFFDKAENAEFRELCQVNASIVEKIGEIVMRGGLDYTEISYDDNDTYTVWAESSAVGRDFGRLTGSWKELTMFPLKYVATLTLTTATPLTDWFGWMLRIPKYSDQDARFLFNTLYPSETTVALANLMESNLKLSSTKGETTTHIGLSVLSLGGLLTNMRNTNDSLKINDSYRDLLRRQTEFLFNPAQDVVAIMMEGKARANGEPDRITHFATKLYDFRAGSMSERNMKNAYLLPDGKVIVQPPTNMLLLPITDFQWASEKSGYVIALRIKATDNVTDTLAQKSVRAILSDLNNRIIDNCVVGRPDNPNGLQEFFIGLDRNRKDFPGFKVQSRVGDKDHTQLGNFYTSLEEMFTAYHDYYKNVDNPVNETACQEALKGISLAATAALVTNGWWIPQTVDHYKKAR